MKIALYAVWVIGVLTMVSYARTMQVQVQKAELRSSPSFLSSPIMAFNYGDEVSVIEENRGWVKIMAPGGRQGWLHQSALTVQKIQVSSADASDVKRSASTEELALAGKGFSKEVESEFKKDNKTADFSSVDRMEKITITPKQKVAFLSGGGLKIQ